MYLWKYWRESRLSLAAGLAVVVLLLWGVLNLRLQVGGLDSAPAYSHHGAGSGTPHPIPPQVYLILAPLLTFPLALFGLRFGGFGVGRDLGQGSGSFLFSRPRTRAFFVWSDWAFGMAQLSLLVLAANAVLAFGFCRIGPGSGPVLIGGAQVSLAAIFALHCIAGLLLVGLTFGLTYFTSVLAKRDGVLLTVGIIAGYFIAGHLVKFYWPGIALPGLTLSEFSLSGATIADFAQNLGLSIALRTALVLAFPVAAQLLLQQRDID